MDNIPVINDSNYTQFLDHVGDDGLLRMKGLRPRDYSANPPGCYAFAEPFPDSLLIPEDEIDTRIKYQEENKSSLLDLREANYEILQSLDQDSLGLCHTADTEVLTEKGWVVWPNYNYSDLLATVNPVNGFLEFQSPFEKHIYPYDGEMVYSTNRRIDFGVTPDHRMMVRKWDVQRRRLSDQYIFQRAKDIGWYAGLMPSPRGFIGTELKRIAIEGDREYDGDDFIAMVALVASDGYAGGSVGSRPGKGTRNLVSFASFREDRRKITSALAHRLGFKECPSRPGVWNRWNAGALAEWFRVNSYTGGGLGARRKCVPSVIKVISERQIKHFLDFFGDRSYVDGCTAYYSTSKRMIDDLQEINLRIGKRGSICLHASREPHMMPQGKLCASGELFTLYVGKADRLCIDRKKHITTDHYKGEVYCAAVPNRTLVTRRNGSVLVSGNCWSFSSTKAMMYLRVIMNEPAIVLSAWWIAGRIKNWRDEGGWGGESLKLIASTGVPAMSFCPSYKSSYDTAETRANATFHKCTEWWEGSSNPEKARHQMASANIMGLPCITDWNFWAHSTCSIKMKRWKPVPQVIIDNSWGASAGEKGLFTLEGNKSKPDGLWIPRVQTPSVI